MSDVNVKCMKNGPLEVVGEITITDDKGQVIKDGQKTHNWKNPGTDPATILLVVSL